MVERYTHGHHESVLRSHSWRTVENSAAYLIPSIRAGLEVLDIGCGPGTITVDLAERVTPGRVIGLDAAAGVLDGARNLAAERNVTNAEFVEGDAYALDFADASFDIVHAHQTLQHLGDPVAALREMRRVVREDGVVAVRDVDYAGTMVYPETPGLQSWADLYQRVHRSNGGEPNAGRRLKQWAREAGFTRLESSASIWCFASDEERAWWGSSWHDRALKSEFAKHAVERGLATEEELQRIADAWSDWAAASDGWMGMPHGELLCRR
ncbi:methyltransferase domain-containing protein [Salinibacterium sp. SYSU T00001]|uniref:methyltransferase domain-containing protein n=1 Tax=Homoserinimonas sedimenticola TaxID=2986805 RepID=UPI00223642A2|nr:methyltransferase domain-containing protein [Salinibacterium sedimenticola]MCW4384675.1 methyltransferase domain-containing protein [Salinibacterium sedimenticola]